MSKAVLPDYRPKRTSGGSQACETMDAPGRRLPATHGKASTSIWCITHELGKSTTARTAIDGCSLVSLNQARFIRHIPNEPSGGKTTDIEIGAFLCERSYGPQHIELLRLIGTLVENSSDPGGQESPTTYLIPLTQVA
jgi:hypothetical protein